MQIRSFLAVTTLVLTGSGTAEEVDLLETLSLNQLLAGDELTYPFLDLDFSDPSASDETNGFLSIASAPGSDFDLSGDSGEYFDLSLDGVAAGRYTCQSNIPGAIDMACGGLTSLNTFSQVLSFGALNADFGIDVLDLLSDGRLDVVVDFGPKVDPDLAETPNAVDPDLTDNPSSENPNELLLSLAIRAEEVPEPATLHLVAGMMGLAWCRRRSSRSGMRNGMLET